MKQEKAYSILRSTLTSLFVIVCLLYQLTFANPVQAGNSPASFGKTSPLDGATNQPLGVGIYWNTSAGATQYEFCSSSISAACTPPSSWISAGSHTGTILTGLTANTTYYWQIRAVNSSGTTYANGGAWWHFITGNGAGPGNFNKSSPANGALGQPITSLTLKWTVSSGANNGYNICFDTSNNDTCNAFTTYFVSANVTSLTIPQVLTPGTTYYWQVDAQDYAFATTHADNNTWFSFTTATDFIYLPLVLR